MYKNIAVGGSVLAVVFLLSGCAQKTEEVSQASLVVPNAGQETVQKQDEKSRAASRVSLLDFFVSEDDYVYLHVKNEGNCTIYRSNYRATAKDASGNVISVSEDGFAKGAPLNTVYMLQSGETGVIKASFDISDKSKLNNIDLLVTADCRSAAEYSNKLTTVVSSNVKRDEDGWSVLGEIKNADSVARNVQIAITMTDENGKLVNAGVDNLTEIPAGAVYPFDISLDNMRDGELSVTVVPTTVGDDKVGSE